MRELAALIRKGLESSVREEKLTWGIVIDEKGVTANVIGLALIGKVGLESAQGLFEAAFAEVGESEGPATRQILNELDIPLEVCEALVAQHFRMTATEIAARLEAGGSIDPP